MAGFIGYCHCTAPLDLPWCCWHLGWTALCGTTTMLMQLRRAFLCQLIVRVPRAGQHPLHTDAPSWVHCASELAWVSECFCCRQMLAYVVADARARPRVPRADALHCATGCCAQVPSEGSVGSASICASVCVARAELPLSPGSFVSSFFLLPSRTSVPRRSLVSLGFAFRWVLACASARLAPTA